jgi:hypothetical protein
MKNILTGNEAIEAYEELQGSYSSENIPRKCGYFSVDDYDGVTIYDKGTIIAFDATEGAPFEDGFGTIEDAIDWINL